MNSEEQLIQQYLRNACTDEELTQLVRWLEQNPENRRTLFEAELALKAARLPAYMQSNAPKAEKERLFDRLQALATYTKRLRLRRIITAAAAAIALAVATTLGITLYRASNAMMELTANNNRVEQIALPDGTTVWLNNTSTLKYPKTFAPNKRKVTLEGEAYFQVAKKTESPFVVQTDAMEITVLGTTFNLNSYSTAEVASVTLIEGEIKVKGNADEGMITLSPGQRAELNKHTGKLYVKEQPHALLDGAWHNKLLPFSQATIAEIGQALERVYGVKVHVSENVGRTTYSGTLKSQDSIDKALRSLKNAIPITYEIRNGQVYIEALRDDR